MAAFAVVLPQGAQVSELDGGVTPVSRGFLPSPDVAPVPSRLRFRPCADCPCSGAGAFPWVPRVEAGAACPCPAPRGPCVSGGRARCFSTSRPSRAFAFTASGPSEVTPGSRALPTGGQFS